jgi:hypothetical protein
MSSSDDEQTPEWLARPRASRRQHTGLLPLHDLGDDPVEFSLPFEARSS